jgi:hypothetical protein
VQISIDFDLEKGMVFKLYLAAFHFRIDQGGKIKLELYALFSCAFFRGVLIREEVFAGECGNVLFYG